MEKNEETKIFERVYIFNFPIERVYLYSTNFSLISFLSHTGYKITNWKRTPALQGETFEGILEPFGKFEGKLLKILNYSSHKKIKSQLIFNQVICTVTKTFYKIQKNNTTLYYTKIKFKPNTNQNYLGCTDTSSSIKNLANTFNSYQAFDYDLFEKLCKKTSNYLIKEANHILGNSYLFLDQTESCILKCPLEEVWSIIKDIKKFREISPLIDLTLESCAVVEDKGENIVKFRYPKGFVIMKVEEQPIYPNCKSCNIIMDLIWGEPKIPLQKISFIFNRITKTQTQLIFVHQFKEPIDNEFINLCSNNKKTILRDLQNYFIAKEKNNHEENVN